jgi:hypothetical protein
MKMEKICPYEYCIFEKNNTASLGGGGRECGANI